jgi:hypothetical protein
VLLSSYFSLYSFDILDFKLFAMSSGSFTTFGKIEEIQLQEKGFYRLLVSNPVPFRTKTLYFNVWDSNRLQNNETNREFDIGDPVKVSFHLKDPNSNFLQLDTLTPAHFNHCPLCYAAVETTNEATSQIDCLLCKNIPLHAHRERISDEPMKLISCNKKFYLYSAGYRLELLPENRELNVGKPFVCVIFPKTLVYSDLRNLIVGRVYNVTAWRNDRLLDLLEIN